MKKIWKQTIAMLLVVLMVGGAAPIGALSNADRLGGALRGLSLPVSAETYSGSCGAQGADVSWDLDTNTGVLTISGTGKMASFTLSARAPWSAYSGKITSAVIENGVTSIGERAFQGCRSLVSVSIPDSVTAIGRIAFHSCENLASVSVPNSVTSIGDWAFAYCSNLTDAALGTGISRINDYAFSLCRSLVSVTIPNSVTKIGEYAFSGCDALTSITIPNSVKTIGACAFLNCTALTSVTIPGSVTSIGDWSFNACTSLTSVTIPSSVRSIGEAAFLKCTGLTSVTILDGAEEIKDDAFSGCTSLASATIPDSVETIGERAFRNCAALVCVTIGDGLTSVGYNAFESCTSLADVYFTGTDAQWEEIGIESNNEALLNAATHMEFTFAQIPSEQALALAEIYYGRPADLSDELVQELTGAMPKSEAIGGCICNYVVPFGNFPKEKIAAMIPNTQYILSVHPYYVRDAVSFLGGAAEIYHAILNAYQYAVTQEYDAWIQAMASVNDMLGAVADVGESMFDFSMPCLSALSRSVDAAVRATDLLNDIDFRNELHDYVAIKLQDKDAAQLQILTDARFSEEQRPMMDLVDITFELQAIMEQFRGSGAYVQLAVQNATDGDTIVVVYPNKPSAETSEPQVITVRPGQTVALPSETETGYAFTGWYTDKACTIPAPVVDNQIEASDGLELFAGWQPLSVYVGYDLNGGASGAITGILVHADTAAYNADYAVAAILANDPPARLGYAFIGWQDPETSAVYATSQQIDKWAKMRDVVFTALWRVNTYTLTFNAMGGECDVETKTVTFDMPYGALPLPLRRGYVFDGWSTAESIVLDEESLVRTDADQTLYAGWSMLGDVSRDESIDLEDVVLMMRYFVGGWGDLHIHVPAGDVNRDGTMNLKDTALLQRYVVGGWNVELI